MLGQFPYQVLWAFEGNVLCGGSIYNKSTIITAAHCCKVFEEGEQAEGLLELTSVMAGRINIDDIVNGQETSIKSYLIHPGYVGSFDHINDICLLTLENELEFDDNVNAIGLNTEIVEVGKKCIVSGWGTTTVSYLVFFDIILILEVYTNHFISKIRILYHFSISFFNSRKVVMSLIYFSLLKFIFGPQISVMQLLRILAHK